MGKKADEPKSLVPQLAKPAGTAQGTMQIATSRAAQEVQAAMVVAKRCPRDETAAWNRIITACRRTSLAEQAVYSYPRGGTVVTGPSIRLAEVCARAWGNLDFGIVELEQRIGESTMLAYAWDLETNTRQTRVFQVKHQRHTKKGVTDLKDPRDIYEMTANQGSRRLRACILGIIPGDVVDAAVQQCDTTLAEGSGEPLIDRVRKMVAAFTQFGVTQAMIEARLGHNLDVCVEHEFVTLRKIFTSIKDGMAPREQFFDVNAGAAADGGAPTEPSTTTEGVKQKIKKQAQEPVTTQPPDEQAQEFPTVHAEDGEGDETQSNGDSADPSPEPSLPDKTLPSDMTWKELKAAAVKAGKALEKADGFPAYIALCQQELGESENGSVRTPATFIQKYGREKLERFLLAATCPL
jgi:hypothetical protein